MCLKSTPEFTYIRVPSSKLFKVLLKMSMSDPIPTTIVACDVTDAFSVVPGATMASCGTRACRHEMSDLFEIREPSTSERQTFWPVPVQQEAINE